MVMVQVPFFFGAQPANSLKKATSLDCFSTFCPDMFCSSIYVFFESACWNQPLKDDEQVHGHGT